MGVEARGVARGAERREDIHVVVIGGETNGYWPIIGCTYAKTVSIDEWRSAPLDEEPPRHRQRDTGKSSA